jgi:hypothetical protein
MDTRPYVPAGGSACTGDMVLEQRREVNRDQSYPAGCRVIGSRISVLFSRHFRFSGIDFASFDLQLSGRTGYSPLQITGVERISGRTPGVPEMREVGPVLVIHYRRSLHRHYYHVFICFLIACGLAGKTISSMRK